MTTEIIEGEAVEVGLAVIEPREMLAETPTPEGMVSLATRMATVLKDIVESQKLYAVIQGKKFPQVEAWMTIARMDNVVAREVAGGIVRFEDGAYEATVELIRLGDGLVIGRGSALCGSKDDKPWDARPEPARRSMAVTRATSRAFRQQYSWIMALAGYEPTPAEEMPRDDRPASGEPVEETHNGSLIGTLVTQGTQDFELRQSPEGWTLPFRVKEGNKSQIVMAHDGIANALSLVRDEALGKRVEVWGTYSDEKIEKPNKPTVWYRVLHVTRIVGPTFIIPADVPSEPVEAPSVPAFADDDLSDMPDEWKAS